MKYKNAAVSIDKIKLICSLISLRGVIFTIQSIDRWISFNLPNWIELCNESINYSAFKYRYSYSLRVKGTKEGTLFLCYYYNGDFRNQSAKPYQMLIEFNPNKEGNLIYKRLALYFNFTILEIKSFDLAFDIPNATVNDVIISTRADIMSYGTTLNRTYYIAPKCKGSGRVKIYDKTIEREKHDITISQLLRIECSFKLPELSYNTVHLTDSLKKELDTCCSHLNSIHVLSRASPDTWELYCLKRLNEDDRLKAFSLMSFNTRKKYKELLSNDNTDYCSLDIDITSLLSLINTLLIPYTKRMYIK